MNSDKDAMCRARRANTQIRKCLEQLDRRESKVLSSGKSGSGFTNGPSHKQSLADHITNEQQQQLLKRLILNQLHIIKCQNQLLRKHVHTLQNQQLSINDLTARNEKLLQEIEELKKNQASSNTDAVVVSRGSSPFHSDVEIEAISMTKKSSRRAFPPSQTFTITRRLPRTETSESASEMGLEIHEKEREEENQVPISHPPESSTSSSSVPRKTRSSSHPNDLVPLRDFIWKRKRLRNDRENWEVESKGKNGDTTTMTTGSELSAPHQNPAFTPPRTRMDLKENYISSPDPESLPSTLFREVGDQEIPEVELGNIEVPTWKKKQIQPMTQRLPGLEDLRDSTYAKRHWKAEEDEKRRKRWDAQKSREEQYVEQLKERLALRAKSRKKLNRGRPRKTSEDAWDDLPWIESFRPNPKEARFIQIADEIPLNVFGHLLPACAETEFRLPWVPNSPRTPAAKKTEPGHE